MDDRELLAFTDVFKRLGNKEPSNQFEMQAVLAQIRTTKGHLSEDTLRGIETLSAVIGLVGYKFELYNQPIAHLKLRTGSGTGSTGSTR